MDPILSKLVALCLSFASAAYDQPPPEVVAWETLQDAPEVHLGVTCRMYIQFHSLEQDWNPYQTRFGPEGYLAIRGWSDEQRLWIEGEFNQPAARVFVPRGGRLERLLGGVKTNERIVLRCVVRTAHLGRPWIEVQGFQRSRRTVPEGTILHTLKAMDLMGREAWALAIDQLDRALVAPLPEPVAADLRAIVARCRAEMGARQISIAAPLGR